MSYLPVFLDITGKSILLVGGGKVALQKLVALRLFTKKVRVVAAQVCDEVRASGFPYREKPFEPADLDGHAIVYACTDDRRLNARIRREAHARGMLVNVVDDPRSSDFISPAVYKKGYMTVAVSSSGRDVKKAVAWRNKIRKCMAD